MVKEGPCRHCGVTSTPLWRNGPPEKPILCNACGSRWRTKGNLNNYTPLHARLEPDYYEDYKVSSIRRKELKAPKRKKSRNNDIVGLGGDVYDYSNSYQKFLDDESSYRSSSGSDESNSESFEPFSSTVGSDLTGPEQPFVWDTTMPSRKRTYTNRSRPSPIEKLTEDLYTIFQEQLSYCSEAPEEQLLYETNTSMVSVEIGHGSVLIRHPSEIAHEEESEASSLSAEKPFLMSKAHLRPVCSLVHTECKRPAFLPPKSDNSKKIYGQLTTSLAQNYRSESANVYDIQRLLGRRDSPLCTIDLNGIVNLEEFAAQFTTEEHRQLMKYLPKSDIENYPNSLKHLFSDPLLRESSVSFQKLLGEGVFDLSFPNAKPDDCRNLRRLALCNLFKSHWIEQYNLLKMQKSHSNSIVENNVPLSNVKVFEQMVQKSQTSDTLIFPNDSSTKEMKKLSSRAKEFVDTKNTGFHPNGLSSTLVTHSLGYDEVENDQDLLLDVKSNYAFPQAELLSPSQCR